MSWVIEKPSPEPTVDSQPFWDGVARGELLLQRCRACDEVFSLPASPCCPGCLGQDIAWFAASGRGTVFSFTVVHHAFHPAFAADVPYVVADIELEEGPIVVSNVSERPHIGMHVTVYFADGLPKFRSA
jgi:hypothetical protein